MFQLNIELASDSKDFSTMLAKTRLAEMTDPTVIPVTLQERPSRKTSPGRKKELAKSQPSGRHQIASRLFLIARKNQGSHSTGKTGKTGKMMKSNSRENLLLKSRKYAKKKLLYDVDGFIFDV